MVSQNEINDSVASVLFLCFLCFFLFGDALFSLKNVSFVFDRENNAGLLGLTRVGSRRVIHIADGFMILFSLVGTYIRIVCYRFC